MAGILPSGKLDTSGKVLIYNAETKLQLIVYA